MIWFVISIVLALCAIGWFIFAPGVTTREAFGRTETRPSMKPIGSVGVILAIIALFFSLFAVVGTRNVGVPTVFGKPTGATYDAGLNFKAPWVKVTDIDATIQSEEYRGDDCIYVKIADAGSACISLAYRWRINPDGADTVFMDYRNSDLDITDAVKKALVSTNIKAAINEVFGAYDAFEGAELTPNMTAEELSNAKIQLPSIETFNEKIKENLEGKLSSLGDLIEVQSVTVSYIKLPDTTESRINAFNAKVMDTKLALQDVATKKAQAAGNDVLARSLQDPNVLVSRCLDSLAAGEFTAPAGFSCWPGQGSSVVIPATR